eukprot:13873349-Ditylum_brightwellii.AAC.1
MSLNHCVHDIGGEVGGVGVGGAMVQQKGESWGFPVISIFCPSKLMQWIQRSEASPNTQREGRLVYTYLGGW